MWWWLALGLVAWTLAVLPLGIAVGRRLAAREDHYPTTDDPRIDPSLIDPATQPGAPPSPPSDSENGTPKS